MGTTDRLIRFTAGLGLMILGILNGEIIGDTLLNVAVSAFGGMNVISAVIGTCPAYLLINFSSSHSHGSATGETEQESLRGRVDEGAEKGEDIAPLRRKLLLSVLVPMLLLLILFGSSVFRLSQQSALGELSRQPDAAVQLVAAYLQDHSRTADGIPNPEDEQQVADVLQPLLSGIELFMLHDATGQRMASTFEKGIQLQFLLEALMMETRSLGSPGIGSSHGMTVAGDRPYLWSTTQVGTTGRWITTAWLSPADYRMSSHFVSMPLLVIVLAVIWLGVWSSSYILRKFIDNVEQNTRNLVYRSLHDPLTGLPNRLKIDTVFADHVRAMTSDSDCVLLMMIDLIGFHDINDTLGHRIGDELLIRAANLLRELENEKTTVLRMGGDVFCLVCVTSQDRVVASRIANTVHDQLEQSHELNGVPLSVQSRIGLSCYPLDSDEPQDLVRLADIALAQAKRQRVKDCFYQHEQDRHSVRKLSLLSRLRTAIEQDELTLVYQPKVNLNEGVLAGVEVLVRWTDTQYGPVSPVEFVTWAEKAGLINKLTRWVMITAERQCREWRDRGLVIPFAVNLSPTNLHDRELVPLITQLIEKGSFGNGMLELELTENAVMEDPRKALETMKILCGMGVSFAIDDFGTGLSSFTYLRRFPVSNLKIDRAFIMDIDESDKDAILLQSMIKLGHNLGCVVTAEGVEDQASMDKLRSFQCDQVQGYFVCKPLPADELIRWLTQSDWNPVRQVA